MSRLEIEEAIRWLLDGAKFSRGEVDVEVCFIFSNSTILITMDRIKI
jgi:hypothetical protein